MNNYIKFSVQATSGLDEKFINNLEDARVNLFSSEVGGEFVIPSAVSGNFLFFHELQSAANAVEENRIMYALENKQLSTKELKRLDSYVSIIISKANLEYNELSEFQPEFLRDFATKSNTCFRKAKKLLKKTSDTVRKSMELFEKFTKRAKYPRQRRMVAGYGEQWSLTHSDLTSSTPQSYFDFDESLSPEAKKLIESIQTLMDILVKLMQLCCQTLKKEAEIFNDLGQMEWIHNRQFNSLRKRACQILSHAQGLEIDEMSKLRDALPFSEFLRKSYHFFDDAVMLIYVANQIMVESKKKNLDNTFEKTYLLDDTKRINIRYAIENFDKMNPKGREGKLSSFFLAALYKWTGIKCQLKQFYDYFWEIYKGKYTIIKYQSFENLVTQINKEKKNVKYKKFLEDMKKNGFNI